MLRVVRNPSTWTYNTLELTAKVLRRCWGKFWPLGAVEYYMLQKTSSGEATHTKGIQRREYMRVKKKTLCNLY
jgi:hypothetical protein